MPHLTAANDGIVDKSRTGDFLVASRSTVLLDVRPQNDVFQRTGHIIHYICWRGRRIIYPFEHGKLVIDFH